MLYLYQGDIYIHPNAMNTKEYKALVSELHKEWKYGQVLTFVFYVYTKKDNQYWMLPPRQRREMVISQYDLFNNFNSGKPAKWQDIEEIESVKNFIDLYKLTVLTDNDLNEMAFREKAEYWRAELLKNNDPELEDKIMKALANSTRLAEEYNVKSMIESGKEESEGCAHFLFEIPEDKKEPHQKLRTA